MASAQATEKGVMEDKFLAFNLFPLVIIHEMESHENQKPMENQAIFKKRQNRPSLCMLKRSIFIDKYSKIISSLQVIGAARNELQSFLPVVQGDP